MNALTASFGLGLLALSACVVVPPDDQKACTMLGCNDGLRVDFSFKEKGSYVVEVTVDGVKTTCRASLPLSNPPPSPCDRPSVFLTLSGSALPAEQQSIGGVFVATTTATHIAVNVTRNGMLLGMVDQNITWSVTAGPNGPDCEPKQCRSAQMAL